MPKKISLSGELNDLGHHEYIYILEHTYEHFRTAHNNRYRFCLHNVKSHFWMITLSLKGR